MKQTQTIDLTIGLQERKHLMNILCVCVCVWLMSFESDLFVINN